MMATSIHVMIIIIREILFVEVDVDRFFQLTCKQAGGIDINDRSTIQDLALECERLALAFYIQIRKLGFVGYREIESHLRLRLTENGSRIVFDTKIFCSAFVSDIH